MEIRLCNEADLDAVYRLVCELEGTELNYSDFQAAFFHAVECEASYCVLAADTGGAVGFLGMNIDYQLHHAGKVATIEELIVTEKYRNKGHGGALLERAIRHAKDARCATIELTSGISRDRAHNFYLKNGFRKVSYKFTMDIHSL